MTATPVGVLRLRGAEARERTDAEVAAFFEPLDHERRDVLIAFGWAMAEDLAVPLRPLTGSPTG